MEGTDQEARPKAGEIQGVDWLTRQIIHVGHGHDSLDLIVFFDMVIYMRVT